jgi:hypothetical protein
VKNTGGIVSHVDESVQLGIAKHCDLGDVAVFSVRPVGGSWLNRRFALMGVSGKAVGVVVRRRLWGCVGAEWQFLAPLVQVRVTNAGDALFPVDSSTMSALRFAAR